MSSDDDRPIRPGPSSMNGNGRAAPNGNGRHENASSSLSEDDGDIPLSQSVRTKSEPLTPDVRALKRKKAAVYSSSSEDDTPLKSSPAKQAKSAAVPMPGAVQATAVHAPNGKGAARKAKSTKPAIQSSDDDSDDDVPVAKKKRVTTNGKGRPAKKRVKKEESDDEFDIESEDDKPIAVKKPAAKGKRKLKEESDADDDEDDKPIKKKTPAKRTPVKKVKKEEASSSETPQPKKRGTKVKKEMDSGEDKKSKKKKKEEEEEEEVYKWWEAQQGGDGSEKWQTLEHNGVYFPPPYEALPRNIKLRYNGKPVDLPPAAEEVAGFYAALLEMDHAKDATFNKNFFEDFLQVLKKNPPRDGTKITKFELCDFRPMYEHFEAVKAQKKSMTTAEKKDAKAIKDALEAPYTHCVLDGRKEKVGNFRVEPPGLFRGRGEHPKKGRLKLRVRPEDVTINIGEGVPIPKPNVPGTWKAVVHDKTVTWLANWVENVNGNYKYVFLAAGSSLKGQSDMQKFEKARELKKHVATVRQWYNDALKEKVMKERQLATCLYFIDVLALRAGNEKGEDEADTVGCCSLRYEHITLEPPNFLVFDFLGKDSIRYYNRVQVDERVFRNIKIFKDQTSEGDPLFDRVETSDVNKKLSSFMKGLTAKVFRTYNASITFQQQLDQGTPEKGTVQEKLNAYNHANRMVAILCNHQRAAPKTHEQSMQKMKEKLRGFKYERMKLRHALFAIDSKFKKKKLYAEDESDLDDDAVAEHEEQWKAREIEKAEKKFLKDNEKLVEQGEKPQPESALKEKIKEVETEFKRLKKERGTNKHELKREKPTDKIEEAIQKLDEKIKAFKLQMEDREAGKEVALGTSKINYLDPRITAAWCKKHDVPIEKIFSKTLLTKFPWAMEVDPDWQF
ncbi:DNA topoisomerase 1 [Phanerochaete sordida]|uniref:DNA topoisomerase I n=1 Tax=Phanerochaete sordida TaxID=48140 RepID=A0A9P3GBI0_9APHY|nr:DNA topoisomerase 1 [Phanerochaete sordida]